jgi:hypothetical protein
MKWWWSKKTQASRPMDITAQPLEAVLELTRARDGREREAALHELVRRDDPRAIAPLLVCAGDWVPQVRAVAQRGLHGFLRDGCIDPWAAALPELAFLRRIQRADLSGILAAIEQFLTPHVDALENSAQTPDKATRRWLFTLRLKREQEGQARAALLREQVCSNDLPIAQMCLRAAHGQPLPQCLEILESALLSRLPRVRIAAARDLLGLPDFDAQPLLRALCFEASAAVRAMAAHLLAQDQGEVLARAQTLLQSPATSTSLQVAALHLLSLLDKARALNAAQNLVTAPMPALRRLARTLRLAAAQGAALDEELLATLADPSPKVRKLAVRHVRRGAPLPDTQRLIGLGVTHRAIAREILTMLQCASPWDQLQFMLELLDRDPLPEEDALMVADAMQTWTANMAHCFVTPTAQQRARLASLWKRKDQLLGLTQTKYEYGRLTVPAEVHLNAFGFP